MIGSRCSTSSVEPARTGEPCGTSSHRPGWRQGSRWRIIVDPAFRIGRYSRPRLALTSLLSCGLSMYSFRSSLLPGCDAQTAGRGHIRVS